DSRTGGRTRDTVLASARLRDHALCADAFREQCLADRVVDLVRARVRQVFALEVDLRTPAFRDLRYEGECRRAAHERLQLVRDGGLELRTVQMLAHAGFEPFER